MQAKFSDAALKQMIEPMITKAVNAAMRRRDRTMGAAQTAAARKLRAVIASKPKATKTAKSAAKPKATRRAAPATKRRGGRPRKSNAGNRHAAL